MYKWLYTGEPIDEVPRELPTVPKIKCPDVPSLPAGKFPPPASFWKLFPSRPLPTTPVSPVNTEVLDSLVHQYSAVMSHKDKCRAEATLHDIKYGASAPLARELLESKIENSPTIAVHSQVFKDTVAWWIRQGYVAGPFRLPPVPNFRSNSMIAVEQKGKIRPIMNMSAPEGESFNDAVIEAELENINMSSLRQFGYSLIECGKGARMWKLDWTDAYKNVPVAMSQLRLQGFFWNGMYFVETQLVFGSKHAVSTFDRLGGTVEKCAQLETGFPKEHIHRTLDDLPFVTPARSKLGPIFLKVYKDLCNALGARLAPNCPDKEKAFVDSTTGTV